MTTNSANRIDGIDFWRGFALLTIFIDHVPENIFQHVTQMNFGFSDAAALIVGLTLPALLCPPEDVARTSAGTFTISYGGAVAIAVLSGAADAYRYLSDTVDTYRTGEEMAELAVAAGWRGVDFRSLTFGTVGLLVGHR